MAWKDFPGRVAGWLGGWVRKAENKAKAQLGLTELGNIIEWKIMTFIEATNVVASQPPERRPTGTLTARAN